MHLICLNLMNDTPHVYPRKKYGQHFLQNKFYAQKIVSALQISERDVILEIGPGSGMLTQYIYLLPKKKFIACEIDPQWSIHLKNQFPDHLTLLEDTILNISFERIYGTFHTKIKVIGNIPYNITTPILFALFDQSCYLSEAVLMVQKEIAERLTASPKTKAYGILTVMLGSKTQIQRLFNVSRKNFFPMPNVDSTVIKLIFQDKIDDVIDEHLFRKIVRYSFNTRRKMLHNSLKKLVNSDILSAISSVSLKARPEELTITDFKRLSNEMHHLMVTKS
jgi:16S rRNA (adenine1518-N6/adenine1519-N6)-dimethyltransferase